MAKTGATMDDKWVEVTLTKVGDLAASMRDHEKAVVRIGTARRKEIRKLRAKGVPCRVIAAACGVTEAGVFADLRKNPV